jgi:rhodanese-related sulfurtransferase
MSSSAGPGYDLELVKRDVAAGDALLLDVREMDEWQAGHLALATLVPLSTLDGRTVPQSISSNKHLYVHCKAGGRAVKAAALLQQQGYGSVTALKEGYSALVDSGWEPAE